MAEYFECTVRYERTTENGSSKKVTESYLVDAIGFGEAEERITEEMSCFTSGEFYIVSIKRYNIQEVVLDEFGVASYQESQIQKMTGSNSQASGEADKWYRVKINLITLDEKTMKEKKSPIYLLVNAGSVHAAQVLTENHMKGTLSDYAIENVVETKLFDVFFYEPAMKAKMAKRNASVQIFDNVEAAKATSENNTGDSKGEDEDENDQG